MAISRKGQYTSLAASIRLLGSEYDFTSRQYAVEGGFQVEVDNASIATVRALIQNYNLKSFNPNTKISTIKQGILIHVRNRLSVFENDVDPENPQYKVKTTVEYNGNNFRLMGGMKIMDTLYCYKGELENT